MILIVDDDALVRKTCETCLVAHGYEVVTAENGRVALERLQRHAVDLVLLDIYMPEIEGIETLRKLKRTHPHIKVIAMSGVITTEIDFLDAAVALGADGQLGKPFGILELVGVVAMLMKRDAKPSPAASEDM